MDIGRFRLENAWFLRCVKPKKVKIEVEEGRVRRTVMTVRTLARDLMLDRRNGASKRQESMLIRTNAEIGIPASAPHHGDRLQGKLPSTFITDYAHSDSSMS